MSYSIIYDKQFLRTTRGIIPLILCGSSNVWSTNLSTGKERRARDWELYRTEFLEAYSDEILQKAAALYSPDYKECYKYNGKWASGADAIRFLKNGIKQAMSIEEIRSFIPSQSLTCHVSSWGKGFDQETLVSEYHIKSTESLEAWIDAAREVAGNEIAKGNTVYYCIRYQGEEPLRLSRRKPAVDGKVIASHGRGFYLSEFFDNGNSRSYTRNIANAIIFESVDDAMQKLGGSAKEIHFVKASTALNRQKYRYAIRIDGGYRDGMYVTKLSRSGLLLSYASDSARLFGTQKEAGKYFNDKIKGRFDSVGHYFVEDVKTAQGGA